MGLLICCEDGWDGEGKVDTVCLLRKLNAIIAKSR